MCTPDQLNVTLWRWESSTSMPFILHILTQHVCIIAKSMEQFAVLELSTHAFDLCVHLTTVAPFSFIWLAGHCIHLFIFLLELDNYLYLSSFNNGVSPNTNIWPFSSVANTLGLLMIQSNYNLSFQTIYILTIIKFLFLAQIFPQILDLYRHLSTSFACLTPQIQYI